MMNEEIDVICIGHLTRDRIVVGQHSEVAVGGAIYYAGMVFLALGLRIAVVTRLAHEDFHLLEKLRIAGASIFSVETKETSEIENIYPDAESDRRICRPLRFAGPFSPEDVPQIKAQIYYISPVMPGEIDLPFLQTMAIRGPLALDVQGLLRKQIGNELVLGSWPEAIEGLALVHYLKVDDREAEVLTGEQDHRQAARLLREMGPKEIILTHKNGVLAYAEGKFAEFPFRLRSFAGRTGRGDTCFSTYLSRRLLRDTPLEAARFAAVLTSLKLEHPGPFQGSLEDVKRLLTD